MLSCPEVDTMNLLGNRAIVFGGSDGSECFSDVFVLDLGKLRRCAKIVSRTWCEPYLSCRHIHLDGDTDLRAVSTLSSAFTFGNSNLTHSDVDIRRAQRH